MADCHIMPMFTYRIFYNPLCTGPLNLVSCLCPFVTQYGEHLNSLWILPIMSIFEHLNKTMAPGGFAHFI